MRILLSSIWKKSVLLGTDTGYSITVQTWKALKPCSNNKFFARPYIMFRSEKTLGRNIFLLRSVPFGNLEHRCLSGNLSPSNFKLIEKKEIKGFSIGLYLKSQLILFFISSRIDKTFDTSKFIDDAEGAFCIISNKLASGDFSGLSEVFVSECLDEIKESVSKLSPVQRKLFEVDREKLTSYIIDADVENYNIETSSEAPCVKIVMAIQRSESSPVFQTTVYNITFSRSYSESTKRPWLISSMNMAHIKFPM